MSRVLAAAQRLRQIPDDVAEIEWEGAARTARAIREPAGVVAGITAWSFPLQLIAAKVGAALAAGARSSSRRARWRPTRLLVPKHPLHTGTKIGPLVSAAQMERVDGYISIDQHEGAQLLGSGSGRPPGAWRATRQTDAVHR